MQHIKLIPREQYDREQLRANSPDADLWDLLDEVKDPEIPVLSIWDMGVLQDVQRQGERVLVTITPTYSGCPAMDVMREDIISRLACCGVPEVVVKTRLAPAWTTQWMTQEGRNQLRACGIAAPDDVAEFKGDSDTPESGVRCPHCHSRNTRRVSQFGSTACKALFQCADCCEPFDYFKEI